MAATSASPASVTSPQEGGPTNIVKMFTTYTNILTEASMCEYNKEHVNKGVIMLGF